MCSHEACGKVVSELGLGPTPWNGEEKLASPYNIVSALYWESVTLHSR